MDPFATVLGAAKDVYSLLERDKDNAKQARSLAKDVSVLIGACDKTHISELSNHMNCILQK